MTGQLFKCGDCHIPGPYFFTTDCTDCHHNSGSPVKMNIFANWPGAGCGSAEEGMCHAASTAVVQAELGKLPEASTFFRHEMAYTTDQYAAKPVKLCGACHVDKLPPMTWGGEPWSQGVIDAASKQNGSAQIAANPMNSYNNNPNDPFGFSPVYDSTGFANVYNASNPNPDLAVTYKTPDWAHANVPCIRCHEHAGITGATVSNNAPANTSVAIASPSGKGLAPVNSGP